VRGVGEVGRLAGSHVSSAARGSVRAGGKVGKGAYSTLHVGARIYIYILLSIGILNQRLAETAQTVSSSEQAKAECTRLKLRATADTECVQVSLPDQSLLHSSYL